MVAVVHGLLHLHGGVEAVEDFLGYAHASQDALFLDEEALAAHGVVGDAAEGGVVAVANVFGKGKVNEAVVQFVNCVHVGVL